MPRVVRSISGGGHAHVFQIEDLQYFSGKRIRQRDFPRIAIRVCAYRTDRTVSEIHECLSDAGIRYYSGTARYHKTFELTFPKEDSVAYFLQLEDVRDVGIARIRINGVDKGIVWTKPFRIEVTDELKEETNDLEISVTNSWHNRVAGDELSVSPKKYTHTNIVLGHDFVGRPLAEGIVLEPSGLLGPVTIRRAVEVQ